jgi:xylan 1,4-beta-xylosidase
MAQFTSSTSDRRVIVNPILPGFHPDPSAVRVEGWVYLVCSTFAWLPGLPVYRSRDLRNWEKLPPVFAAPGSLDLLGCACDDGLYAPGIRHDGHRFLVACTVVRRDLQRFRNFLCTSEDPSKGWSSPVWLPEDMGRIDPTPFVDDDGRVYLVLNDLPSTVDKRQYSRELRVWELDRDSLLPIGSPRVLWHGALIGAGTPEAPRLFKRGGWYYLLIAEGGTGDCHAVTMARSRSLTEPFIGCPANPLLTHRHLGPNEPIRCVGHADLFPWEGDDWWACCLAERRPGVRLRPGRETWLAPVHWPEGEWPVFAPGAGRLHECVQISGSGPETSAAPPVAGWLALRSQPAQHGIAEDGDDLFLPARAATWDDRNAAPSLVGRRITTLSGHWTARLTTQDRPDSFGVMIYCTEQN